ncbi:ABC transporter permease [Limnobaculum parvum]|uniref:ABC transporter permease n=1 Tax=Limnobaculum parvum TaxID=2172103 RepID=A0A2Y9U2F7_9GAMM|nr:FtsX-like permease family protein [Limnobaculum parvum]AWH89794.1 ABC transporter permease [Limnobaculum parvum]
MIPFKIIYADFRRLWGGTLILILLIAAAVAFSIVVNLQERALREGSARAADRFDLIVGAAGSETQLVLSSVFLQPSLLPLLPHHYLDELKQHPLVASASPLAFGDSYKGMPIIGTDDDLLRGRNIQYGSDGLNHKDSVFGGEYGAIVGAATGLSVGDKVIPIHGQVGSEGAHPHESIRYTVTGVLSAFGDAWDKAILVPITAVWAIHGAEEHEGHVDGEKHHHEGDVSAVVVKPKSIAGAYQLRSQYRAGESMAVFPGEVLTRLYGTLGDVRQILSLMAIGTQVLVVIAILMVIVVHLEQRKRQLGALRAFGAPQRGIVALIWSGLMLMMTTGIMLGVIVGYLATLWISQRISSLYGMKLPVTIQPEDGLLIAAIWGIIGVILLLPAVWTYRYSPAEALKV